MDTSTLLLLTLVAGLVVPPLVLTVWTSLTPGSGFALSGSPSFEAYVLLARSGALRRVLGDTVVFLVGSVAISTLLGSGMAWAVARTDTPLKGLAYACVFVQFAVPGSLEAIGWILLLGRGAGLLNRALDATFGIGPFAIQSMGGMIVVQALSWTPLVFLLLVGPLRTFDTSLEEAARVSGAPPWRIHLRITLPLLLPTVLSVVILIAIRAAQAFEVPLFIGTPAGIRVFTTEIYGELRRSYLPDYATASAFAVVLSMVLFAAMGLYHRATRFAKRYTTVSGRGYRVRETALGRARVLAAGLLTSVFVLTVAPLAALAVRSVWPGYDRIGSGSGPSLYDYRTLLQYPDLWRGLRNSLTIGVVTATVTTLLALAAAWLLVRTQARGRRLVDQLLTVPIVIPGTVLGLAFLITYLRVPLPIYGTLAIFVLAYTANYSPYAMRFVQPALTQLDAGLEEAGEAAGAPAWAVAQRIIMPLLRPALLGAWLYVFFHAFRDLSIAAMITTARTPVVATQLLDLWTDGRTGVLAAYGTLLTAASTAVGAVGYRWVRQSGSR
jgi:iron(III) transport system permease protein